MESKSKRWSKKEFITAVQSSISFSEALRKIGLRPCGANFVTIKKFIKEWEIDTSHFLGQSHLNGKIRENIKHVQIPLDKILVKDNYYNRKNLKQRLIREKILDVSCKICSQKPEWNGKKLTLVLDHVNGINNDNRIENLRLVCPNCNSQLDTFCGRKNKKEHKCETCGNKIYKGSKRCIVCARIDGRKTIWPSYEQIKEDMKDMPMVKVGEKYGVSDNAVRKWIKYYEKKKNLTA